MRFKFKYWIFLFTSQSLYALTTLNVTLSSDNNPGGIGDLGDLRYCLNSMNQGLNTIPDDYAITFAFPMTIQLNGILPIINNSPNPVNITIGNPNSPITIDGNSGSYNGFFIPMGNVTIQNMNFQNLDAKVNASTYSYQDHNRKKGVSYTYAITAFNQSGSESSPVSIVINP